MSRARTHYRSCSGFTCPVTDRKVGFHRHPSGPRTTQLLDLIDLGSSGAGINQRARVLRDQIIKHFGLGTGAPPRPTIHLIGKSTINLKISMLMNWFIPHWTGISLGGLACRKLATMPNLEFEIMSAGTPHQGTKVASVVNNITLRNNLLLHTSYTVTLTHFFF